MHFMINKTHIVFGHRIDYTLFEGNFNQFKSVVPGVPQSSVFQPIEVLYPLLSKNGLISKCYKTLANNGAILKPFYAFILPSFQYCSPIRCSAFSSYLKLLYCTFNIMQFFLPEISINLKSAEILFLFVCYMRFYLTLIIHFNTNSINVLILLVLLDIQPNKTIKLLY